MSRSWALIVKVVKAVRGGRWELHHRRPEGVIFTVNAMICSDFPVYTIKKDSIVVQSGIQKVYGSKERAFQESILWRG